MLLRTLMVLMSLQVIRRRWIKAGDLPPQPARVPACRTTPEA